MGYCERSKRTDDDQRSHAKRARAEYYGAHQETADIMAARCPERREWNPLQQITSRTRRLPSASSECVVQVQQVDGAIAKEAMSFITLSVEACEIVGVR